MVTTLFKKMSYGVNSSYCVEEIPLPNSRKHTHGGITIISAVGDIHLQ